MSDHDFMPIDGWDHLEIWVGNAKQSAYFYENAYGFTRTAYAGPETGVRDRASYVLEQGRIRIVLTGALVPGHEIGAHVAAHGDGVKVIALGVPDVDHAYREATARGAVGVEAPRDVSDEHGTVRRASIEAYGDTLHTFVDRSRYGGAFLPGYAARDVGSGDAGLLASDLPDGLAMARKRLAGVAERRRTGSRLGFGAREVARDAGPARPTTTS